MDTPAFQFLLKIACGNFIQLPVENPAAAMQKRGVAAFFLETFGGIKTSKDTTNNHGMAEITGAVLHLMHIIQSTETHNTFDSFRV